MGRAGISHANVFVRFNTWQVIQYSSHANVNVHVSKRLIIRCGETAVGSVTEALRMTVKF